MLFKCKHYIAAMYYVYIFYVHMYVCIHAFAKCPHTNTLHNVSYTAQAINTYVSLLSLLLIRQDLRSPLLRNSMIIIVCKYSGMDGVANGIELIKCPI